MQREPLSASNPAPFKLNDAAAGHFKVCVDLSQPDLKDAQINLAQRHRASSAARLQLFRAAGCTQDGLCAGQIVYTRALLSSCIFRGAPLCLSILSLAAVCESDRKRE